MKQIKFKATEEASSSCDGYRQIIKSGDTQYDFAEDSDDVIILYLKEGRKIIIDCNKETGEFCLKFNEADIDI